LRRVRAPQGSAHSSNGCAPSVSAAVVPTLLRYKEIGGCRCDLSPIARRRRAMGERAQ